MRFSYKVGSKPIGFYEINGLPGCNQVAVSNHAWISPDQRNQGFGQLAHEQRLDQARELGYDYMICTVLESNEVQIKILDNNGWTKLSTFNNRETGHRVCIYGHFLRNA
jgi:RimJ/RimL family protein N-acetyltransferase